MTGSENASTSTAPGGILRRLAVSISTAPGGIVRRLAGPPVPGRPVRGPMLLRHLAVAIVALAVMWYLTDHIQAFYDFQIATIAAYLCVVAGLTVLTGVNGQVSLGHSALMAVGRTRPRSCWAHSATTRSPASGPWWSRSSSPSSPPR